MRQKMANNQNWLNNMKKQKKVVRRFFKDKDNQLSSTLNTIKTDLELSGPFFDMPLKYVVLIAVLTILLVITVFILMYFNLLDAFKPWFLSHFDELNFIRYSKGSTDIGILLIALITVTGLAVIHPVLGICGVTLTRCWLDGYTYPTDNVYFVWAIILISISYVIHTYLKKQSLKIDIHTSLLFLFVLFLIILLPTSYQVGKSYRYLMLWASYACLFFTTYGSIKSTSHKNILIWAIIITLGLQTWYAFFHFRYVLPFLRKSLLMDPALRIKFFGTTELSNELIYRFNINRAFGTMLFPNALGGFILLFLPICIYLTYCYLYLLFNEWQIESNGLNKNNERWILVQTAAIWFISTIFIYATGLFPITYSFDTSSSTDVYLACGLAGLVSLIPSGLFAWICINKGYNTGKYFILSLVLIICSFFGITSLWLTYSRGSWLSLILSICFVVLLSVYFKFSKQKTTIKLVSLAIFILILYSFFTAFSISTNNVFAENTQPNFSNEKGSNSSAESGNETAKEILETGVGVSWEHLRDPSSFRLRWSYWKVGLNMWKSNFLTGVGLGNFALAYPHYQYLGAGDVKECHNGYLQILCETGIVGGIFFLAFVITLLYKIWKGLRDKKGNFYTIAWSIGILGFLIHAGLDIHFSHPSLVTYFLIGLSLFLIEIPSPKKAETTEGNTKPKSLLLTISFALVFIILFVFSTPPYTRDLVRSRMSFFNVGKDTEIPLVLKTMNYVFTDVLQYAIKNTDKQPKMSATVLKFFFVDLNTLRKFGNLYVPEGKGSNKAVLLPEGEPVPENAVLVVKQSEAWMFVNRIRRTSIKYAKNYLENVDKIFPYQEDIPNYISEIYKLVFLYTSPQYNSDVVDEAREGMLRWSKEALKRSPQNGDLYYNYGKVLWHSAVKDCEDPTEQINRIKSALDNLEKCAQLWKNVPFYWYEYIAHAKDAIEYYKKNNLTDDITRLQERIDKANQYVSELVEKRSKLHI